MARQHAAILTCLVPFIVKLSTKDLEAQTADLKKDAVTHKADQDDSTWEGLFDLIRSGEDRLNKHRSPRSAIRKPTSGGKQQARRWELHSCFSLDTN